MSWIDNLVSPRIRNLLQKKEIPDNLWEVCEVCKQMIFSKDLQHNLYVCPNCCAHKYIPMQTRFNNILDNYEIIKISSLPEDPLKFKDLRKYTDRIKEHRNKTKLQDAFSYVLGKINGLESVVGILDFSFMGGSMGRMVGNGFKEAIQTSLKRKCPFIIFTASGGARMQEGILSLMQMPKTVAALHLLKEEKIPYIVVLTNPTTGGVSASFATLGDVLIAEPGAIIGFAGARVINNTLKQMLPDNFQRAEGLLDNGMIDMIIARKDLKHTLTQIMQHLYYK